MDALVLALALHAFVRRPLKPGVIRMTDLLYIALTAVLFTLTWGLTRICDSV